MTEGVEVRTEMGYLIGDDVRVRSWRAVREQRASI